MGVRDDRFKAVAVAQLNNPHTSDAASPAQSGWLDDAPDAPGPCGHTEGPGHDCAYVEWRNSLIPHAERFADTAVGRVTDEDAPEARDRWNRAFLAQMDRLVAAGRTR